MAAYDSLKSLVQQAIRTNGNNEITGQVLQNVLMAMIDELGGENGYAGVATPSTNPGAPDGKVFYFATEAGTYTHFDGATLAKGIHLLVFNGVTWSHQTLYTIDSEVTSGSNNLITSGAVYTKIINAINALDATVSKSAGADGLSLSLTETDGKVTSISGSIAPKTYDAYGAASAAQIAASTDATNKVNAAKTQILGDAASDYNTLGKLEDKIQAEASRAAAAESALNTAKADKATTLAGYGINDAYTKTEVNGLVSTPHQNYVTVPTYASLPATGSEDTIYRVSNYNGSTSQVDASVYSEYAWNGSGYTFLRVVSQIGEVFDITVYNSNTKYADLAAALGTNGANVPSSIRRGGMSVKFVQSYDNKYVQFRYMLPYGGNTTAENNKFKNPNNWQGVDDEPTAGSKNLVESGGVYEAINVPITENILENVVIIEAYCADGLPDGSKLRIQTNTNNLQVGVIDSNDEWIAIKYVQPNAKGIVTLDKYSGSGSTSPYATKVLLYADFNNYNNSALLVSQINIQYVNDIRYSVRIKEYLDTQDINSSINELDTKTAKNKRIIDSNAVGVVSSGTDLSLIVKEIYVKSVSLSDVKRLTYWVARDKKGDGSVYDNAIRLVNSTGGYLITFYNKEFKTSDYGSADAARQAAIDDLNYIYTTFNGDGIVLIKDNLTIGSVIHIYCELYDSCTNKYAQPSIFNANTVVKFTEDYDANEIIKELYTKGDIYTGTFFRMKRGSSNTQIAINDTNYKVVAVAYIPNVSSFSGYVKLNATSGSSSGHAAYRTDYYAYIQFDNYKDIAKAVLYADIVHDPKNSLLCYIKSQEINSPENSINIEDSFICSKVFDNNKTEKYAHNQNCDFDNMGNCLLSYCFSNSNFEENEYGGAKKLVRFNVANPNNITVVKEWADYSADGEHMYSMPSPFFDGTVFRVLYSDNGTLYIADETCGNPVVQTINNVPFTIENYNSILSSVFGISISDADYQYFSAEGTNFYLQTKIYYYSASNEYYLLISTFRGSGYNYKVPMLLKSTDLINWTPVLLLHKYDGENNRVYIRSKAESSIACKNGNIYIAVRGGDSDFSSTPVNIITGTTVIAYALDSLNNSSIPFYLETIEAAEDSVLCEGKPFIDFIGDNPIVLTTKGANIYDSYMRNSIAVFDCSQRSIVANINRSTGIFYPAGRSYNGGLNITFIEDFRDFFTTQNTNGKYSNIRYAKLSI